MRVTLDNTAARQVEDFARRTGRTASAATSLLIAKSFQEWHKTPLPEIEQRVIEHGNGVTVSAKVRGDMSEALRKYAAAESRSLSSVMKRILRERLTQLGYLPLVPAPPQIDTTPTN
jgi:hypothetical protein